MPRRQLRRSNTDHQIIYNNFNFGMEYNSHIKSLGNKKVQELVNFDLSSDGKPFIRNPLLPYQYKDKFLAINHVDDQSKFYQFHKLLYAPFKSVHVPFIWVYKLINKNEDNALSFDIFRFQYFDHNNVEVMKLLILPESYKPLYNDNLSYIFKTDENRLYLLCNTIGMFTISISETNPTNLIFEKEEIYIPTLEEIRNTGVNLFKNNPFIISNKFYNGKFQIENLIPYKLKDKDFNLSSKLPIDFDQNIFDISIARESSSDQLFLKPALRLSENIIKEELSVIYSTKVIKLAVLDIKTNLKIKDAFSPEKGQLFIPLTEENYNSDKLLVYSSDGYSNLKRTCIYQSGMAVLDDLKKTISNKNYTDKKFHLKSVLREMGIAFHWAANAKPHDKSGVNTDTLGIWSLVLSTFMGDIDSKIYLNKIGQELFNNDLWEFDFNDLKYIGSPSFIIKDSSSSQILKNPQPNIPYKLFTYFKGRESTEFQIGDFPVNTEVTLGSKLAKHQNYKGFINNYDDPKNNFIFNKEPVDKRLELINSSNLYKGLMLSNFFLPENDEFDLDWFEIDSGHQINIKFPQPISLSGLVINKPGVVRNYMSYVKPGYKEIETDIGIDIVDLIDQYPNLEHLYKPQVKTGSYEIEGWSKNHPRIGGYSRKVAYVEWPIKDHDFFVSEYPHKLGTSRWLVSGGSAYDTDFEAFTHTKEPYGTYHNYQSKWPFISYRLL